MKSPPAVRVGILILDDDPDVADYLASVLEPKGYVCHKAGTAAAALRILAGCTAADRPAAAIVDLILKDENGMNAAEALVRAEPSLRILLISGYADTVVQNPLPNGRQPAFLAKVFTAAQLQRTLATLLAT